MQPSTPIHRLKRQARLLARGDAIPLHEALDRVAAGHGFRSWSHLASSVSGATPASTILSRAAPGDMVLLAARPGHGKTLLGLELASMAGRLSRKVVFFTLDYHERDIADRFTALGLDAASERNAMIVDTSDDISAAHIIRRLEHLSDPAMIVIDYLQLLDQKRANPSLDDQIRSLREHVKAKDAICIVISQIDRSFELSGRSMPELSDIRLPNPLDLRAFDKACFLHNGRFRMEQAA